MMLNSPKKLNAMLAITLAVIVVGASCATPRVKDVNVVSLMSAYTAIANEAYESVMALKPAPNDARFAEKAERFNLMVRRLKAVDSACYNLFILYTSHAIEIEEFFSSYQQSLLALMNVQREAVEASNG
jgi:hypothetical protein